MTDHAWLNQYPFAKTLPQQDDDELLYTPCHVGLPEDQGGLSSWAPEVREWVEDDI
jgi:hypothetical protein